MVRFTGALVFVSENESKIIYLLACFHTGDYALNLNYSSTNSCRQMIRS